MQGSRTSTLDFATGVGVDPVVNNDYVLTVRSGTDTVTVGGVAAKGVSLFTITKQTPKFNIDPFLGIQGMGSSAEGFFAALIRAGLPCEQTHDELLSKRFADEHGLQRCSACS